MKYISALILIFSIVILSSCDGKSRGYKSNKEILEEHNQLKNFGTKVTFYPTEYTEKVTDTLLINGIKINIKHYSDSTNAVTKTITSNDTKTLAHHYRDFNAEIIITTNNKNILNKTFSKSTFLEQDIGNNTFLNNATMRVVEVNQTDSLKINNTTIDFVFCKPETDHCLVYKLHVKSDGNYNIEQSDDTYYNEE